MKISIQELKKLSKKALSKYGYSEEEAKIILGDKIRSKILDSGEIEVEDNLLNSIKSFVEGN